MKLLRISLDEDLRVQKVELVDFGIFVVYVGYGRALILILGSVYQMVILVFLY